MITTPEELYKSNEQFIFYILNRRTSYYDEDMVECAKVGLWKACKKYDPTYGYTFSTFAYHCIMNELNMEYRRRGKYSDKEVSYDRIILDSDENIDYLETISDDDDLYRYYDTLDAISNELSNEEKKLLFLSANYKQGEIAKQYHMAQGSISRRLKKIRDKLRKTLN